MIRINLLGEPTAAPRATRRRPEISLGAHQGDIIVLVCLGIAALAVGLTWWSLSARRAGAEQRHAELQREKQELQEVIDKVQELERQRSRLTEQIEIINQLKAQQHGPVRIMDEVSRALPDLVWLTRLSVHGSAVTIAGAAMDENAVANYITNLDESPFFSEPVLKDMRRGDRGTFQFTLECTFHLAEATSDEGGSGGRS